MNDFDNAYHLKRKIDSAKRSLQHQNDFSEVKKFIERNESLLKNAVGKLQIIDIGCSDGEFSKKFNGLGEVTGVEINQMQALEAKKKISRVLDELPFDEIFDIVLIRGTLQHLPTDNRFFDFLENNLESNCGIVAILSNPNSDSIIYKRTGSLPALDVGGNFDSNFHVYSPKKLKLVLEKIGVQTEFVSFPYLSTPYSKPIRDFIAGATSLIFKTKMKCPFPRSMFNLIAIKKGLKP
jgi:SAM-dependent methyltransferase